VIAFPTPLSPDLPYDVDVAKVFSWLLQIEAKARPRGPEGKGIKEKAVADKQPSSLLDIKKHLDESSPGAVNQTR
jgi:hypothetical protein